MNPVAVIKRNIAGQIYIAASGWSFDMSKHVGESLYTSCTDIPEGWKLVPIDPTQEMFHAGFQCIAESTGDFIDGMYAAMLEAAPKYKGTT